MIAFVRRSGADSFDVAALLCQVGYRRLRADAAATVASFGNVEGWGSTMRPLDPDALRAHRSPLVPPLLLGPDPGPGPGAPPDRHVGVPLGRRVARPRGGART